MVQYDERIMAKRRKNSGEKIMVKRGKNVG